MITLERAEKGSFKMKNNKDVTVNGANSETNADGYTPFELLCSSVSLCMALSIDALVERDELEIEAYNIYVEPHKAEGSPSRIERLTVQVELKTNLDEEIKTKLISSAKRACTVGNTLKHGAEMDVELK
ncbi:OsmC family protein [Aquibacillus rhizosphaerae]|uniref:OsmC family protein n=1 Tax=Aquibacillus rhizosphaerae TaxID=3051431 RepID=A0ABT7L4I6_9BACI|nr:OsmC family protein [Aquibacillus sp. LR5S19]MDL4839515.1 OsmC family protein [Aquibacillus sp. LR5S19]